MQYRWLFNFSTVSASQFILPTQTGGYRVVVSDNWHCTDTSTSFSFTLPSGVAAVQIGQMIVHPNPANTAISVSGLLGNIELQILDITGKVLLRTNARNGNAVFDIAGLQPGLYFIHSILGSVKFVKL
jgi:hypothetical protein